MKAIISHDVDHITVWEHKKDLILPKFIIRSSIELLLGSISRREYYYRFKDFLKNKWQNIEELMAFDKQNEIPATFFVGVSNGLGLSYSFENAKYWIKRILERGFGVGVHGIAYNSLNDMKKEFETFKEVSGKDKFGIRMHYLRANESNFEMLEKIGYVYDSTFYGLKNPFKIGNLWEFPLCLMDGRIFIRNFHYQNQSMNQAKDTSKKILEEAFNKNLKYFNFLFHDRYFSDSFWTWKEWYIWFIEYLKENKIGFITFEKAIEELSSESK